MFLCRCEFIRTYGGNRSVPDPIEIHQVTLDAALAQPIAQRLAGLALVRRGGLARAGARGDTSARIFSTNFGPELVSIAGVYRTFERGIPQTVAGRRIRTVNLSLASLSNTSSHIALYFE